MSSDAYRQILGQVELLSKREQLDLIAEILKNIEAMLHLLSGMPRSSLQMTEDYHLCLI